MATFTFIDSATLDAFLTGLGFSVIPKPPEGRVVKGDLSKTEETVYGRVRKDVRAPVTIRVYTSMVDEHQRDNGADAIRIVLVTRTKSGEIKMIRGFKRVHRVAGWRENLRSRIEEAASVTLDVCPDCGGLLRMVDNKARGNSFMGCCEYPTCRYTRDIPKARKAVKR